MKPFFVYMLRCADGSFYVGHTDDLDRRIAQHEAGEIAGYTHSRRPVTLAWSQETASREEALAAEQQVKGWARAKKEALVRGDWGAIRRHAWGSRNPMPEDRWSEAVVRPSIPQGERGLEGGSPFDTSERTGAGAERPSIPQGERGLAGGADEPSPGGAKAPRVLAAEDQDLVDGVLGETGPKQRRAIAKTITLLESTRPDHRARADQVLNALLPSSGGSLRLGISGVPGVGKSTFIESLGMFLIERGHRVAVLAVDPSSSLSGGSILGDKTRMERLSVHPQAYIRPSPTGGALGGVAEKTREAMRICEAAGYDVVIVETVGVGQSETAVAGMTDLFVLMQLPNAGDELQTIKRGVMELADIVLVNKADLDPDAATRVRAQITTTLRLIGLRGRAAGDDPWQPQVLQVSALAGGGIEAFWREVERFRAAAAVGERLAARRREQDEAWMWERIDAGLKARFRTHPQVRAALPDCSAQVRAGRLAASAAARRLLELFH